jgi:hypothetical protein
MSKIVKDWNQELQEFKDKLKILSKDGEFICKETKNPGVYATYHGKYAPF